MRRPCGERAKRERDLSNNTFATSVRGRLSIPAARSEPRLSVGRKAGNPRTARTAATSDRAPGAAGCEDAPMPTGADAVVAQLEAAGVELVFGLPGVHNLALWDALRRSR